MKSCLLFVLTFISFSLLANTFYTLDIDSVEGKSQKECVANLVTSIFEQESLSYALNSESIKENSVKAIAGKLIAGKRYRAFDFIAQGEGMFKGDIRVDILKGEDGYRCGLYPVRSGLTLKRIEPFRMKNAHTGAVVLSAITEM